MKDASRILEVPTQISFHCRIMIRMNQSYLPAIVKLLFELPSRTHLRNHPYVLRLDFKSTEKLRNYFLEHAVHKIEKLQAPI